MTAEERVDKFIKDTGVKGLPRFAIIRLMKEHAKTKCKEQRELCCKMWPDLEHEIIKTPLAEES